MPSCSSLSVWRSCLTLCRLFAILVIQSFSRNVGLVLTSQVLALGIYLSTFSPSAEAESASMRLSIHFPPRPVVYQPNQISLHIEAVRRGQSPGAPSIDTDNVSGADVIDTIANYGSTTQTIQQAGWVSRLGGGGLGCGFVYDQHRQDVPRVELSVTLVCL